ncbi:PAS domain S-box protein [Aneurinibacillus sp. Ricciae_BoGa-3]|uniref:bifunctional diguanylate cyclase/phosphodiesterase n=1 Tax=Aneurinibacillus sp. Ricciae_BoGa-3 TaxID=3022697 RepID=UPI00233FE590|nr:bifunctional diguanylate cyclase/phosphodiesterase [Aneurinibacillus sp. Ricciae_BoGa-3]WCK52565.1 PAS domain S-box protein [Aneurinibacillus sp. Ricciae_BoGa-3]
MPYKNSVLNKQNYMELEERFRSLLSYNPDAICTISREGIFESVNPATVEITGYTPEEINSTLLKEITGKRDLNKIGYHFKRTLEGSSQNYYLNIKHKNGTIINLSIKNVPIQVNRKIVGIFVIAKDITKQKNIERELKDSESKYRLITENMSDVICVLDHDGIVEYASPSHKSMTGFSAEEYIGVRPFQFIHPEDVIDIQNRFDDIITNKQEFQVEHRYKHVNGDWIVVEANVKPVVDEFGHVKNVVIIARDITQRKKTEEELQESEKRLRTLINVLPDGIFFKDGEGRWLEVNSTALDLFELGDVPYRGKTDVELAEYTPRKEDLLSCFQTDEQAWTASEMVRVEEVIQTSDGNSLFLIRLRFPFFIRMVNVRVWW